MFIFQAVREKMVKKKERPLMHCAFGAHWWRHWLYFCNNTLSYRYCPLYIQRDPYGFKTGLQGYEKFILIERQKLSPLSNVGCHNFFPQSSYVGIIHPQWTSPPYFLLHFHFPTPSSFVFKIAKWVPAVGSHWLFSLYMTNIVY